MKNESLAIISKRDISITKIKKFFDSIGTAKVKKYLIDSQKMTYHICIDGQIMKKKLKENQSLVEHIKESNLRFDAIDKKFDAIDKKFDAIDKRFEAIDKKFEAIENRIDQLEIKFDKKFETMENRINQLEIKFDKKFEQLETKFDKKFDQILYILQNR